MSLKGIADEISRSPCKKDSSEVCKGFERLIKKIEGEHDDEIDFKINLDFDLNMHQITITYFNRTKNPTRTFASYIESEKGINLIGDFCREYDVATVEYRN